MRIYAFADEASPAIDGQIAAMRRNGLNGLEIRGVDGENVSAISLKKAKEVRRKLDDAGLCIWSIGSPIGKIGIDGVESNLGTAIRTGVVLVMAWLIVFVKGKQHTLKDIPKNELGFICLSGLATGGSWLCYYKALQDGLASVVVPIDKLSILVSIGFSALVFKERLSKKAAFGLVLIVGGTLMMLI